MRIIQNPKFKFQIARWFDSYIVKKKAIRLFNDLSAGRQGTTINRGFTIIELLIVMLILVVVGGLMTSIFVVSLRSTNKSNNLATVRQNGNGAIEQMSRKIRYATELVQIGGIDVTADPSPCSDGTADPTPYSVITFHTENPDPNIDTPILNTFSCNTSARTVDVDGVAITDNSRTSVLNCSFSCIQQSSGSTVNIYFKMSDMNGGTGTEMNENVVTPITFSTSITLRNTQ